MSALRWILVATLYATLAQPLHVRAASTQSDASEELAEVAGRYYEAQAQLDPLSATFSGDNRFDDQLSITIAPEEVKKLFALYHRVQTELAAIDRARLSYEDSITYDLLSRELDVGIGFEKFSDHLLPLDQMGSVPILLANFGAGTAEQPLKTVAHYDAYLNRIARLPQWADQAIANMREGIRQRIVQPKPIVEALLPQLRSLGSDIVDNAFFAPIRNLPASIPEAERQRLTAAYRDEVEQRIAPSMRKLARFVETDYLPASRQTHGWGALPNGAEWYRQYVRQMTTMDLSPDEIHAIGLKEVARIHAELARVAPLTGYEGDQRGFLPWMRTNERFLPFRSEGQVLDAYREVNRKVMLRLPELFGRLPRADLEIRPEPDLTKETATDHYTVPTEDGSRPGVFWTVIKDPAAYNATVITYNFLHEGQPGHHFQMALQLELAIPQFRKRMWINPYGEGWALYAETLGHEMDLYGDPAAHAGQLRGEMVRAVRLVVDTGIHARGWTREQAMKYLMDYGGSSEVSARTQIERYMAWPAQALGYKLGSLKIQELRERAKLRLGAKFSIKSFHDAVLGEGSLPLSLLDSHIDRWIATQQ